MVDITPGFRLQQRKYRFKLCHWITVVLFVPQSNEPSASELHFWSVSLYRAHKPECNLYLFTLTLGLVSQSSTNVSSSVGDQVQQIKPSIVEHRLHPLCTLSTNSYPSTSNSSFQCMQNSSLPLPKIPPF